jgi:hypothetical protein
MVMTGIVNYKYKSMEKIFQDMQWMLDFYISLQNNIASETG